MNEEHPNGCYGLRCSECKLMYAGPRSIEDRAECKRLFDLALKKMTEEE